MSKGYVKKSIVFISLFTLLVGMLFQVTLTKSDSATGSFNTQNVAPPTPSSFGITTFTSSLYQFANNASTHIRTARMNWTQGLDNNGDTVTNKVCVASAYPITSCDVVGNITNNTGCAGVACEKSFNFNTSSPNWDYTSSYSGGWYNKTYYVAIYPNDAAADGTPLYENITLMNRPASDGSALSPTATHDPSPDLTWTAAADPDVTAGSSDVLTYHLMIGSSGQASDYVDTTTGTNAYTYAGSNIAWGSSITGGGGADPYWVNSTGHVTMWVSDKPDATATGGNSSDDTTFYEPDITLYNRLPYDVTTGWAPTETHDQTPSISWTGITDADSDTFTYYFKEGTSYGATTYNNNVSAGASSGTNFGAIVPWGTSFSGGWVNRTVYVQIIANDTINPTLNDTAYRVTYVLYDDIPTAPSTLNTTDTHDSTPSLSWDACTEGDSDTITYHIYFGSSDETNDYNSNTTTGVAALADMGGVTVPWGTAETGDGWVNRTVYGTIWCTDSASGIQDSSGNYSGDFILRDKLPDVTVAQIANHNGDLSTMTLTPTESQTSTVAVKIQAADADGDCTTGHTAYITLCRNATGGATCDETNDNNYNYQIDSVSGTTTCSFVFTTNISSSYTESVATGPAFWRSAGGVIQPPVVWKLHVNVTESGTAGPVILERASDAQRDGTWTFAALAATNMSSTIALGQVSLNVWNNMTTNTYNITNTGNIILNLSWNATNFTGQYQGAPDTCDVGHDCLFIISNTSTALAGDYAYLNWTAAGQWYQPGVTTSTGLLRSTTDEPVKNNNATYWTYYHIFPPLGLLNDTYQNTITVTQIAK